MSILVNMLFFTYNFYIQEISNQPHVRKDMAQHGIARGDSLQHIRRAVTILNPGAMDLEPYAQSSRIGTNVALAALDLFPASYPLTPQLSVVFTL